jgi:murein peptide amidase A
VIISVHAPFGVLDMDGPAKAPRRFGRLYFNRVGVYPGSLGNYGGLHKNVPVITIELPNALAMPQPAEVRRIWQDMLAWIEHSVPSQAKKGTPSPIRRASGKGRLVDH